MTERVGSDPEDPLSAHVPGDAARGIGVVGGFLLLFEGLGLVRRRRDLWRFAIVPLALSLLLASLVLGMLYANAGDVHLLVSGWMPSFEARAWYEWIWVGPLRVLVALVGYVLFLTVVAFSVVAAGLVANVVAAPFLDALSQAVERIESGQLVESGGAGILALVGEVRRSVLGELQRVAFFLAASLMISLGGFLIPGAQLVAPWLLVGLTIAFLPLDYAGHLLDRRQLSFRARRAWLRANLTAVFGFGSGAFLVCMVPGLNLVLLPGLVAGGTLLAVRVGTPRESR